MATAQQMLHDTRIKTELLRMQIVKLTQSAGSITDLSDSTEILSPLELRVEDLRHHLRVEAAVAEGAKNVVKLLGGRKVQDRKALAEVRGSSSLVIRMQHCNFKNKSQGKRIQQRSMIFSSQPRFSYYPILKCTGESLCILVGAEYTQWAGAEWMRDITFVFCRHLLLSMENRNSTSYARTQRIITLVFHYILQLTQASGGEDVIFKVE